MVLMRHALEVALTHDRSEAALRAYINLTASSPCGPGGRRSS